MAQQYCFLIIIVSANVNFLLISVWNEKGEKEKFQYIHQQNETADREKRWEEWFEAQISDLKRDRVKE